MANFQTVTELRNNLENPQVPLSLGLLSMGYGSPTDSNEHVNERSSLQVPTVVACVRILSQGVGSLPLRVYEELDRGRKLAKDHYLYRLLGLEPNPESTATTLWTTLMTHVVLWQNGYAEIERDAAGRAIGIWPRLPWRTKSDRINGVLVYKTTDTAGSHERIIRAENMLHFVGFSLDGFVGTSLITEVRQSIGLAMAAARYGARFYANNARPGGVIKLTQELSPEDMTNLRQDLELMQSGANTHRIAVLPPGMSWDTISVEPVNAQYIETRKMEREEICAVMRVPGYMAGITEKVLKSTVEAQNREFLTYSLRPYLETFEQELQRKLLPMVGRNAGKYTIKFYLDELLRADYATRIAGYKGADWLSINDKRELENLPLIEGGDNYLQPLNMQDVTKASTDLDTEDEPAVTPSTTRTKTVFLPILKDAISRIQHRAKKDSSTFTQTLAPVCIAVASTLRTGDAGAEEAKAIEKYISGAEVRSKGWTEDPTEDEFSKLYRSLVFAINRDIADAKSREVISHE